MSLESLFLALGRAPFAQAERQSTLLFALTQSAHVIGLALLGGSMLVGGAAALGLIWPGAAREAAWRGLLPTALAGFWIAVVSGVLLVSAGPLKYYTNPVFFWKMGLIALSLGLTALVSLRARRVAAGAAFSAPWRLAIGAALAGWLAVVLAGRAIGLV